MERTINTKFFRFRQNNSGGYFVRDETHGIAEEVFIEAIDANQAKARFKAIGEKVSGFWSYCSCCGERWSPEYVDDEDGTDVPLMYGKLLSEVGELGFRDTIFIHYLDGKIESFELKPSR